MFLAAKVVLSRAFVCIWHRADDQRRCANMVGLYERPACQVPPRALFSIFLSSCPFSCSTAPQAFSRPDRVLSQAGARRCCQGWPLFSGHTLRGLRPLQQSSTTAGLMSRVDYAPVYFTPSSCQRALFGWRMFFGRPCYEVHGACDVRINLYPAAPFRLAKVLFAWTIVQAGWDSSF